MCRARPSRPAARAACAARLERAVELYQADFFLKDNEPFEEWALGWRERLRDQALDTRHRLAEFHEIQGNYERAARLAARQLERNELAVDEGKPNGAGLGKLLVQWAWFCICLGRSDQALELLDRALGLLDVTADRSLLAATLYTVANPAGTSTAQAN